MYDGIINIYKEPGYTSHDVVARLRGITHQKKIGHTGTLDPNAEGVLCVCLGAATRVCDMLTDATKEYEAVIRLGITTDTQDMSGTVLEEKAVSVDESRIRSCIEGFVGEIDQIPPMYSAIRHNGRRLYELARAGIEVERSSRRITIYGIDILSTDIPEVSIRVTCSKGTYIRTLCNDIGSSLGCGACMKHLIRTGVGRFRVEDSIRLDRVEELMNEDRLKEALVSPFELFGDLKHAVVFEAGQKAALNGNMIKTGQVSLHNFGSSPTQASDGERVRLSDGEKVRLTGRDGFFYGVYRYDAGADALIPVKMFLC